MKLIKLDSPIWSSKSVGLDERIVRSSNETFVEIAYTNKRGWRIWPDRYYISEKKH